MKLILYIGHHKVGSTALQAFLAQNAHRLMQDGILYPGVDPRGLIHMLRQSLGMTAKAAHLPPRLREPHSALAYRMIADVSRRQVPPQFHETPPLPQMIDTLKVQMARLNPETVILCTEVFSTFGEVTPALVDQLINFFPKLSGIQIYCALRRPDQYLVSWHGQRMKAGEQLDPLARSWKEYLHTVHLDYTMVIEPWIKRCPEARITLRDYADVMADDGNSVRDFRRHSGLKWPAKLIPPPRTNFSLHRGVQEIARLANNALGEQEAHDLRAFLMECGKWIELPPNGQIDMLGQTARAKIAARFDPVHARLGEITGKSPFFGAYAEITKSPPIPEPEATETALKQMTPELMQRHLPNGAGIGFVQDLRRQHGFG